MPSSFNGTFSSTAFSGAVRIAAAAIAARILGSLSTLDSRPPDRVMTLVAYWPRTSAISTVRCETHLQHGSVIGDEQDTAVVEQWRTKKIVADQLCRPGIDRREDVVQQKNGRSRVYGAGQTYALSLPATGPLAVGADFSCISMQHDFEIGLQSTSSKNSVIPYHSQWKVKQPPRLTGVHHTRSPTRCWTES
jgi:hypothetical protein